MSGKVEEIKRYIENRSNAFGSAPDELDLVLDDEYHHDDIAEAFSFIPLRVQKIRLIVRFKENEPRGIRLKKILAAIPSTVRILDLYGNCLGALQGNDLGEALSRIPASVKELSLRNNLLGHLGGRLALACENIPKTVTMLDLSMNDLSPLTADELSNAFSNLSGITTLHLIYVFLERFEGDELAEVLRSIPESVKNLNLTENSLGSDFTIQELTTAINNIHKGLITLDLSFNKLGVFFDLASNVELEEICKKLPNSLKELILSQNHIAKRDSDKLEGFFEKLSQVGPKITMLDISYIGLENLSDPHFALIFEQIPNSVTTLIINGMASDLCNTPELCDKFKQIPESVVSLTIRGCKLGQNKRVDLGTAFACLPKNVESLDLSSNMFGDCSDDQFHMLFAKCPSTVKRIHLSPFSRRRLGDGKEHSMDRIPSCMHLSGTGFYYNFTKDKLVRFPDLDAQKLGKLIFPMEMKNPTLGIDKYVDALLVKFIAQYLSIEELIKFALCHANPNKKQRRNRMLTSCSSSSSSSTVDREGNGSDEEGSAKARPIKRPRPS